MGVKNPTVALVLYDRLLNTAQTPQAWRFRLRHRRPADHPGIRVPPHLLGCSCATHTPKSILTPTLALSNPFIARWLGVSLPSPPADHPHPQGCPFPSPAPGVSVFYPLYPWLSHPRGYIRVPPPPLWVCPCSTRTPIEICQQETCQARGNARPQGCTAGCPTLKRTYLAPRHGFILPVEGLTVLSPHTF